VWRVWNPQVRTSEWRMGHAGPGRPNEDRSSWPVSHFDEDTGRFMKEVFDKADALLLGRRTYEILAAARPKITQRYLPGQNSILARPRTSVRQSW
jgi:dihydrofolate reductase